MNDAVHITTDGTAAWEEQAPPTIPSSSSLFLSNASSSSVTDNAAVPLETLLPTTTTTTFIGDNTSRGTDLVTTTTTTSTMRRNAERAAQEERRLLQETLSEFSWGDPTMLEPPTNAEEEAPPPAKRIKPNDTSTAGTAAETMNTKNPNDEEDETPTVAELMSQTFPETNMDTTMDFLSSMTFAFMGGGGQGGGFCECCDEGAPPSSRLPDSIARAVQEHRKNQQIQEQVQQQWQAFAPTIPRRPTQERILYKRQGQVSVWHWTLPLHAEPLCEYGSASHRLIWVRQLPPHHVLQSLGTSSTSSAMIIGSQTEEQARPTLPWTLGSLYLLPGSLDMDDAADRSRTRKAVGLVHSRLAPEPADNNNNNTAKRRTSVPAERLVHDSSVHNETTNDDDDQTTANDWSNTNTNPNVLLTIVKVPVKVLVDYVPPTPPPSERVDPEETKEEAEEEEEDLEKLKNHTTNWDRTILSLLHQLLVSSEGSELSSSQEQRQPDKAPLPPFQRIPEDADMVQRLMTAMQ